MKVKSLILCIIFIILCSGNALAANSNLLDNGSFEQEKSGSPDSWSVYYWDSSATPSFSIDKTVSHEGGKSAFISNNKANDSRYSQKVKVDKDSNYKLSCYIKTENVGTLNRGANISVEGINDTSADIKGTRNDWTYVELYGRTLKDQSELTVTVGLGGYSSLNTGKAWFDDIKLEKIDKLPDGVKSVYFSPGNNSAVTNSNDSPDSTGSKKSNYNIVMLTYCIIFIIFLLFLYNLFIKKNVKFDLKKEKLFIFGLICSALILRLIVAPIIEGWPNDISANKAWAMSAARNLFGFYNSGWCDYPPVFIYVLFIVGKFASIPGLDSIFTLLVKLPAIIADLVTAYILFKIARKQLGVAFGLLAGAVYAFLPPVLLDSTIWGQVDSFFAMIIVLALYKLLEKKFNYAVVLFTVAVLMKPQGIFFFPLILFELIKDELILKGSFSGIVKAFRNNDKMLKKAFMTSASKNIISFLKASLKTVLIGLVTTIIIILPFSFTQEPLWLIHKFFNTAKEYPFADMNAFNFFGLFQANFKNGSEVFLIFSYDTWGIIFDALIVLFAGFIYLKGRHKASPLISALILNTGIFIFSTKMHERYMFPAIAIALMAVIYFKDRKLLVVLAGFSATIFANIHVLFYRMLKAGVVGAHFPPDHPAVLLFSFINVLLFIYLVKISYDIIVKDKLSDLIPQSTNRKTTKIQQKNSSNERIEEAQMDINNTRFKPDIKDFAIMAAMTVIYLIIALINLGDIKTPQTSWTPYKTGESFVVDLGKSASVARFYYYEGICEGNFKVEYLDDRGAFVPLGNIEKNNIFLWKYIDANNIRTNKLRISTDEPGSTLNEIAVVETGYNTPLEGISISDEKVDPGDSGKVRNLIDEQNRFDYKHTYLSGMIFDEIYHARTAFEFIHHIKPFEWTHPPLGKVFISLGVMLFGMDPFGWRIVGTLFGVAMIPIMYLFGLKLFSKRFYAFCTAFLMMFDFMHFSQSRISTIDVYGTFFVILMYYFMYDYYVYKSTELGMKKSLIILFVTGLFFGLGSASKWIGLYAGGGLAVLLFMTKYDEIKEYLQVKERLEKYKKLKKPEWFDKLFKYNFVLTLLLCVLFFVIIPAVIYGLSYIPFLNVTGSPNRGIAGIIDNQRDMYIYHSKTVLATTYHPFSSHWWEWPLLRRPLETYINNDLPLGKSSSMTIMGNPAIWWVGIFAVLFVICLAFIKYKKKLIPSIVFFVSIMMIIPQAGIIRNLGVFALSAVILVIMFDYDRKLAVLFTAIAFQYLPWVPIERLTFIYHFFSTVPFMILVIVYVIKITIEKHPELKPMVYVYLGIVALLFIMFYPVLSGMEVSRDYVTHWLQWNKDRWIF